MRQTNTNSEQAILKRVQNPDSVFLYERTFIRLNLFPQLVAEVDLNSTTVYFGWGGGGGGTEIQNKKESR